MKRRVLPRCHRAALVLFTNNDQRVADGQVRESIGPEPFGKWQSFEGLQIGFRSLSTLFLHHGKPCCTQEVEVIAVSQPILVMQRRIEKCPGSIGVLEKVVARDTLIEMGIMVGIIN